MPTFPKHLRLRLPLDFKRLYARKCSASIGYLALAGVENDLPHARFGLSVSRKVGNAVARNRWKRLLREAFRLEQHRWPAGLDAVAIPRAAEPPSLAMLREELTSLAARLQRRLRNAPASLPKANDAPQKPTKHPRAS